MNSENIKNITNQAMEQLIGALKAGKSEALTNYLAAVANFHRYSFQNILLIARQCPQATRIAGFHTWRSLGRFVKKGEKGLMILAPLLRKVESADACSTDKESRIFGFRTCTFSMSAKPTALRSRPSASHRANRANTSLALNGLFANRASLSNTPPRSLRQRACPAGRRSSYCPEWHRPSSSRRWFMNSRMRCCTVMVLAAGITALQVTANPYVAVLGAPKTASSRLNLAQAEIPASDSGLRGNFYVCRCGGFDR